ncbi:hypothetical protein [Mesorhizobium australicum]|uniref:hypothetical protein n=1 Tax=Mesorhizobium australicum TaxID=536018 RepID=UPI00333DCEE6
MRADILVKWRRIFGWPCRLASRSNGSWGPADYWSLSAAVVAASLANAQANAKECPPGHAANEQEGWEGLANNARQNADWYVVDHGAPEVSAMLGEVSAVYQDDGEYEGQYLVVIKQLSHPKHLFMVLRPRFDFCSDISSIDEGNPDLFEVIFANIDSRNF